MCVSCWEDFGRSEKLPADFDRIEELIRLVYDHPEGGVGGNLHIVLDDWNLETDNIEWCLGNIAQKQAGFGDRANRCSADLLAIERELVDLLLPLTEGERAACLAKCDQYF